MNETLRIVEALLFASAEPLGARDIHERIEGDVDCLLYTSPSPRD